MKTARTLLILILFSGNYLFAQEFTQIVKGKVIDKDSHAPIAFASVAISNGTYATGTITNSKGEFKIENVPIGRKMLQISFIGYESVTMSNLEVTTAKELTLNIKLSESIIQMEEVAVKAQHNKMKPLNTLASISARTFSVEESKRYAGSANDVSRMATNFAGVKASNSTVNEIVIRGNSPIGLIFRLDGIDIPNPNHFGDGGTTGGVLSMLNNNVLANSDFITGAFPAEYANTISGVFDLNMRTGNTDKHEFIGQVGLQGCEFGAEGPLSKKNNASYLIHYRYSTVKLMSAFIDVGLGSAIPNYQDVSFKFNFPTSKKGTFSLIALMGKSTIKMLDSERDTTVAKSDLTDEFNYEFDYANENYSGTLGFIHSYRIGQSSYAKFILAASSIMNKTKQDSLSIINRLPTLQYSSNFQRTKYTMRYFINKKIDSQHSLRTGIAVERQDFNLSDSLYMNAIKSYRTLRNFNGGGFLIQPYAQYQYKVAQNLFLNVGLSAVYQSTSNDYSIEPRAGLNWEFLPQNTLSLAYGLHSLATPIEILNQRIMNSNGTYITPNTQLDFTKSNHLIVGYDKIFKADIRLKTEIYYQYITNAVVEQSESSYSLLNRGSNTFTDADYLKNGGRGYNYGAEITLEKFMHKGSYFLSTLSLYESKYRGSDNVLRNTAFNSNYVFNLLAGKEFDFSPNKSAKKRKKIVLDAKFNWAGGQRFSPIDVEASKTYGLTKYDDTKAYSLKVADFVKLDLRCAYKWMGSRATQELALDLSNVTNRKNVFYVKYEDDTNELKKVYQFGFMPEILYRINF